MGGGERGDRGVGELLLKYRVFILYYSP